MKKKLVFGIIGTIIIVGGGIVVSSSGTNVDDETKTFSVVRKDISHSLHLTGKLKPVNSMVISPRQSGRILTMDVKEGSQVKQGDLLFSMTLESSGQGELLQMRSQVKRLELEAKSMQDRLNEKDPVRELLASSTLLKEENELEKLKVDLQAARARLRVMESDLGVAPDSKSNNGTVFVRSPKQGIITLIDKNPGDFVLGGAGFDSSSSDRMVMVVADMSRLLVRTRLLEADMRHVKLGLPVKITLDAWPELKFDGTVKHIGGQGRVDRSAGYTYFDMDVEIDAQDERVLPEMNASVELLFEKKENVLTLPVAGVALYPNQSFVHVEDKEEDPPFRKVPVTIGVVNETDVEITSGLSENDKVIEIDFAKLAPSDEKSGGGGKKLGKKKRGKNRS